MFNPGYFQGVIHCPRSTPFSTEETPWANILPQFPQCHNLSQDCQPSPKSKEETCCRRSLSTLAYVPFLSVHNTHTYRHPAEATNIIGSKGEHIDVTFHLFRYLPLAHVRLAYHRSRTPAPRHLYMNPLYFEARRLPCIVLFHKRLTGLQKNVNTLCWLTT